MAYLPEIVLEWILLIYLKIFFVINFYLIITIAGLLPSPTRRQ
jgi:hypothetical protein